MVFHRKEVEKNGLNDEKAVVVEEVPHRKLSMSLALISLLLASYSLYCLLYGEAIEFEVLSHQVVLTSIVNDQPILGTVTALMLLLTSLFVRSKRLSKFFSRSRRGRRVDEVSAVEGVAEEGVSLRKGEEKGSADPLIKEIRDLSFKLEAPLREIKDSIDNLKEALVKLALQAAVSSETMATENAQKVDFEKPLSTSNGSASKATLPDAPLIVKSLKMLRDEIEKIHEKSRKTFN
ncbi:MAG: hypothetical protein DRN06_02185 [Thermoprotei archaeon]|nr:MAG: hypothetical protein DRN06_02185 [Thermoprotei archaeon]